MTEPETFDPAPFRTELAQAPANREVGKRLLHENDRVKVWDITLEPGERVPFHCHALSYFWVCVEPGPGYQRRADGTARARDYRDGEVVFETLSEDDPAIHDLENRGAGRLRFVTVELKDDASR